MIKKKVCMLGDFAVGKTSLVRRFVYSVFSEKYLTTIGVKIDKKVVRLGEREVSLILWDIHGDDELARMLPAYLRGTSGFILVADGTRRHTIRKALDIADNFSQALDHLPSLFVVNKSDLRDEWEVEEQDLETVRARGWLVLETSAKLETGVEEAFVTLAERMLHE